MGAAGEEVGGLGGLEGKALFFQQRHVPGQGGRVTGDIYKTPGAHPGNRLDSVGAQPLPGGIHGDDIRADAVFSQLQSGLTRVAAEKFRVLDAVAQSVFPGVRHRLGYNLHADHLSGGGGHGKGDGARAAVQVQDRVVLCDPGKADGGLVQPLRLGVIHLVK